MSSPQIAGELYLATFSRFPTDSSGLCCWFVEMLNRRTVVEDLMGHGQFTRIFDPELGV